MGCFVKTSDSRGQIGNEQGKLDADYKVKQRTEEK